MVDKNTAFNEIRPIKLDNNKLIDFSTAKIMGILNLTPDSFYDGGRFKDNNSLLKKTEDMILSGADIIDVGAVSTRPGAHNISCDDELKRIINTVALLTKTFPDAVFSIDTYRSKVAEETIAAGAHIINDISGGTMDKLMFETIARLKVPYILMHINGTPLTMQKSPVTDNITSVVKNFFQTSVEKLTQLGVSEIIIDPGFGFGKSLECNYTLLKKMNDIRINNLPILAGISRKSMINKLLNTLPQNAINGTTSLNTIALLSGANILRVHDVEEAKQVVIIIDFMQNNINCK
ncbi:MAG: dihydropteroate synthase [Bacteroidetes bacterium]|nr:dihydropteroate synthase [Bacteroidota bacterium]MBL6944355.1 dihydropteroate synthase [Bacteroidales bacterium]